MFRQGDKSGEATPQSAQGNLDAGPWNVDIEFLQELKKTLWKFIFRKKKTIIAQSYSNLLSLGHYYL